MEPSRTHFPPVLFNAVRDAHIKKIPAGQILLYEDDLPQDIYILKSGVIKLYDIDEQGSEKILHIVQSPTIVPMSFFSGMTQPLRWFYETVTDCEVYNLAYSEFNQRVSKDSQLAQFLTNSFSNDVHELLERLSSLSKTNSRDKVIAALKFLVVCYSEKNRANWWQVEFNVHHQLIADLCGLTRESTALVMKSLQDQTIIRYPKIATLEINKKSFLKRSSKKLFYIAPLPSKKSSYKTYHCTRYHNYKWQ